MHKRRGRCCLLEELKAVSIGPNPLAQSGTSFPKSTRFETRRSHHIVASVSLAARVLDLLGSDLRRSSGGAVKEWKKHATAKRAGGHHAKTCYLATIASGRPRFINHAPIHRPARAMAESTTRPSLGAPLRRQSVPLLRVPAGTSRSKSTIMYCLCWQCCHKAPS